MGNQEITIWTVDTFDFLYIIYNHIIWNKNPSTEKFGVMNSNRKYRTSKYR